VPLVNNVALTPASAFHSLDLVLVEVEGFAALVAENLCCFREQHAACCQFVHGSDAGVGRADWSSASGQSRASATSSRSMNSASAVVGDAKEGADEIAVIGENV